MRILLANAWHDDNKGDSAIALATLGFLHERYPGAEVRVASLLHPDDPAFATAYRHVLLLFPETVVEPSLCPPLQPARGVLRRVGAAARWALNVPMAYARRRRRPLRDVDLVVLQGGSNVFDSGRGLIFGFLRLAQVLYPAWAAQRAGVPTVFLGHTLGPFPPGPARWLVRRVLAGSQTVVLREDRSRRLAERLGVPAGVLRTAPDMAFAIAPAQSPLVEDILTTEGLRNRPFAVFAVRRHPYRGDASSSQMVRTLGRAARRMLDEGVVEQVVVVAHTVGPTPVEDDREISHRLAETIGHAAPVIERDLTAPELAALYGHAEVVVSVRLHAALLALAGGTPAYAISYFTAKTEGVMAELGMADRVGSFDDLDEHEVFERARALVGEDVTAVAGECRRQLEGILP
jgi:polysaccharide pyruvyl transferase WcaK-like protein